MQRRLAAILAADVVGYSRLTGADEEGTIARLQALRRELIDPTIDSHGGRIVKTTGDGILIEFVSVVDAVRCAIEVQREMASRNSDVPPEKRIEFRIGINLGDVVVEGDDLLGDGVNVAARLEGIAEPGCICVSEDAYRHTRDKVDATFFDMNEQRLKNIERPVRVYRVGISDEQQRSQRRASLALPNKFSVAVLPFHNMSGDPEQEYFADGIVEDIITALSRFRQLFVIARNSTFTYKGRAVDVKQVGRELGVRYVLEGSVRRSANHVRVTAQLVDAADGGHVWAERYDRQITDVFDVQDELTARIATAVDPAIRQAEMQAAMRKHPSDLASWDHLLRGLWHVNQFKKPANAEARREFEEAVACDPRFAPAHAWLAFTHVFDAWFNWTDDHAGHLAVAYASAGEAVRLDDAEPMSHVAVAFVCFWTARIDQARTAAQRALSLNPNSFLASFVCGGALNYSGRCEEAVPHHLKALDLSPNDPLVWNCLGSLAHTYLNLRRFNDAVNCADRAIAMRHGYLFGRVVKISALGHAGRLPEAEAALKALLNIAPDFTVARMDHYPFVLASQRQHLIEGLAAAGLKASPA